MEYMHDWVTIPLPFWEGALAVSEIGLCPDGMWGRNPPPVLCFVVVVVVVAMEAALLAPPTSDVVGTEFRVQRLSSLEVGLSANCDTCATRSLTPSTESEKQK